MSVTKTGTATHDTACNLAEGTLQVANASATMNAAGQATCNAAAITWARAIISSAKANNNGFATEPAVTLLRSLGTGGV